MTGVTWLGW